MYKRLKEWTTKAGYPAVIMLMESGNINGYVGVEEDSILYGMNYYRYDSSLEETKSWSKSKINLQKKINNISVHGELTYSREGDNEYLPGGYWWFGFDTMRAGDGKNFNLAKKELWKNMTYEEKKQFESIREIYEKHPNINDIWRKQGYVEEQCELLAKQLKKIEES